MESWYSQYVQNAPGVGFLPLIALGSKSVVPQIQSYLCVNHRKFSHASQFPPLLSMWGIQKLIRCWTSFCVAYVPSSSFLNLSPVLVLIYSLVRLGVWSAWFPISATLEFLSSVSYIQTFLHMSEFWYCNSEVINLIILVSLGFLNWIWFLWGVGSIWPKGRRRSANHWVWLCQGNHRWDPKFKKSTAS